MRKTYILLLFLLLLDSCGNEPTSPTITDKTEPPVWILDSLLFHNNKIQGNSYSNEHYLYIESSSAFTIIPFNGAKIPLHGYDRVSYYCDFSGISDFKYPINDKFFVTIPYPFVPGTYIKRTQNPIGDGNIYFEPQKYDSTFVNYSFLNNWQCEIFCLADNFLLLNYYSQEKRYKYFIIEIDTSDYSNSIKINSCKAYSLEPNSDIWIVRSFYGKFFASIYIGGHPERLLLIRKNGDTTSVLNESVPRIAMDPTTGYLYAFANSGMVYCSVDKGESWGAKYLCDPHFWGFVNFARIDSNLIAYQGSQIWKVNLTDTGIDVTELPTDELRLNKITSVSQFQDSLVYCTTLSGGFIANKNRLLAVKDSLKTK